MIKKKFDKIKKYAIAGSLIFHIIKYISTNFKRLRRKIDYVIGFCIRKVIYSHGSIQNNKIFVATFDNRYSCNAKYIVEEILKQNLPVEIVWVSAKKNIDYDSFPDSVTLVRKNSYSMYKEMSISKIWIDNALNCVWDGMPKKQGQFYLNTWHGSLGIKRLSGNRVWMRRAKRCNKVTDFCISNSQFEDDVFHGTFWKDVPSLELGHARNDILFPGTDTNFLREKVCSYFEINQDSKIFLYAPTFRDSKDMTWFDLDFERLKAALTSRFGGEWIILLRMHFKNSNWRKNKSCKGVKDASAYVDIQELLAVADAGATDYSSWAYDYVLTRRPLFLYVPDLEAYDQERGFYYPIETTPFPIAMNNEELEARILSFNERQYRDKVAMFLQEKGCIEDGHASERVVELIKKIMGIEDVAQN